MDGIHAYSTEFIPLNNEYGTRVSVVFVHPVYRIGEWASSSPREENGSVGGIRETG
jgi:hypothetical protein